MDFTHAAREAGRRVGHLLSRIRQHVPPGVRSLLGLALIAGGLVGFLPILGFWMIPLGIAVIGLDVAPWWRAWRGSAKRLGDGTEKGKPDEGPDASE